MNDLPHKFLLFLNRQSLKLGEQFCRRAAHGANLNTRRRDCQTQNSIFPTAHLIWRITSHPALQGNLRSSAENVQQWAAGPFMGRAEEGWAEMRNSGVRSAEWSDTFPALSPPDAERVAEAGGSLTSCGGKEELYAGCPRIGANLGGIRVRIRIRPGSCWGTPREGTSRPEGAAIRREGFQKQGLTGPVRAGQEREFRRLHADAAGPGRMVGRALPCPPLTANGRVRVCQPGAHPPSPGFGGAGGVTRPTESPIYFNVNVTDGIGDRHRFVTAKKPVFIGLSPCHRCFGGCPPLPSAEWGVRSAELVEPVISHRLSVIGNGKIR